MTTTARIVENRRAIVCQDRDRELVLAIQGDGVWAIWEGPRYVYDVQSRESARRAVERIAYDHGYIRETA